MIDLAEFVMDGSSAITMRDLGGWNNHGTLSFASESVKDWGMEYMDILALDRTIKVHV